MLGDSAVLGGGGDAAATASAAARHEMSVEAAAAAAAVGGSNSGSDIERGERSSGGNRWPRQETLALLEIRSDMDVAFRDASVKGPLWEQVSMKLAELGYHRSAKKCKEKFENVYKYHKRTKDGRTGKSDGKTYRFFDQLEALDHIHSHNQPSNTTTKSPQLTTLSSPPSSSLVSTTTTNIPAAMSMPPVSNTIFHNVTVPSTTSSLPIIPPNVTILTTTTTTNFPPSASTPNPTNIPIDDLLSNSSSYSTSSDDDETTERTQKRKRKWKDFFERLMKEVIEKQEELQRKFLEAIEKREHERMVRDEAWRTQELQRINREREILAQERSIAAAKDASVMSLLQKIAEQQNLPQTLLSNINIVQQQPPPPSRQQPLQPNVAPSPVPLPLQQLPQTVQHVVQSVLPHAEQSVSVVVAQKQQEGVRNMEIVKVDDNNVENSMGASSSRWPKVEVNALIKLRTNMDSKYQENGPKGPLWEDISASMRKLGYNRNAKRCKEKWENINKYFKKVKESNKRRPEDSKTCPYFHQLDALYREKKINNNTAAISNSNSSQVVMKAEESMQAAAPLMVRPEQQWPPQQQQQREEQHRGEEDDMEEDDDKDEEDEEEDEGGGSGSGSGGSNFEIVASKPVVGGASTAE